MIFIGNLRISNTGHNSSPDEPNIRRAVSISEDQYNENDSFEHQRPRRRLSTLSIASLASPSKV